MEPIDSSVSHATLVRLRTLASFAKQSRQRPLSMEWCNLLKQALQKQTVKKVPWRGAVAADENGDLHIKTIAGGAVLPQRLLILPHKEEVRADTLISETKKTNDALPIKRPADAASAGLRPGDVLCDAVAPAATANALSTVVHWFGERPLLPGRTYHIIGCADTQPALVGKLKGRLDGNGQPLAAARLEQGDTGVVELELDAPIIFDAAMPESPLSWLLLTDIQTDEAVGLAYVRFALRRAGNITWQKTQVDAAERARALGQEPFVLWFTGYSGSGKSTIASLLEKRLHDLGKHTYLLDGDNIRHGLCKDLGFTDADRVENLRRVAEVARLFVDAGLIVLVSFISPFANERQWARSLFPAGRFLEVFVDTPLEICEARDVKGLYAKARAGKIRNFTGIDSPYERPENPDIHLFGAKQSSEEMVETILECLRKRQLI